jgi:hypothetical protein
MAFLATVIKVMIASPSDVANERNIIERALQDWNPIHSTATQIILLPVRWEKNASPAMGDRPQEIINKQVLDDSDLLIGVFWTRLGTPTGPYPSGTVEEIERHLAAGKPAMLYFSSAPVKLESVDNEQYKALTEFKKNCQAKGLCESYESLGEFQEKLQRQIVLTVYNNNYIKQQRQKSIGNSDINVEGISVSQDLNTMPSLSDDAKTLLKETSLDKTGIILNIKHMGGSTIQTNGKQFNEPGNHRSEAQWEAAIEDLLSNGLLQPRGHC